MAFDHESMATQGLFPGKVTTRSIANLGHFKLEVIIEKLPRGGAGTAGRTTKLRNRPEKDKYKITMRVYYKTRVWEYEAVVGVVRAKVMANLLNKPLPEEPSVEVYSVTKKEQHDPTIEVYKK